MKKKKAVFFDRDSTLNKDPGYINDPKDLELYEGTQQVILLLKQAGFLVIVATNQSGVARGLITEDQLNAIHRQLNALIAPVFIDYFAICMHHPDEKCLCRKPQSGLLLEAAQQFNIDLSLSYMVGDRETDVQAGKNVGCQTILLTHGAAQESLLDAKGADFHAFDLKSVSDWILRKNRAQAKGF